MKDHSFWASIWQSKGRVCLLFGCSLLLSLMGTSCQTTSSSSGRGKAGMPPHNPNHPAVRAQNERISLEPAGDYYIGRRYWTEGTRFWGYLRRPGEPWIKSRLVIMNEDGKKQPDRLQEVGAGMRHGYDHNYEYKIWGSFTGNTAYDPNSNFVIPEFYLRDYELVDDNPGFLFMPGEGYAPGRLPPKHPPIPE